MEYTYYSKYTFSTLGTSIPRVLHQTYTNKSGVILGYNFSKYTWFLYHLAFCVSLVYQFPVYGVYFWLILVNYSHSLTRKYYTETKQRVFQYTKYTPVLHMMHGLFLEKFHHYDTKSTCISRVAFDYVSARLFLQF